jgi:hypothetical protein
MLIIIVCGILVAVAIVMVVLWGDRRFTPPDLLPAPAGTTHWAGLRLYLWWASIFSVAGAVTSVLVTGAGGRLIMRVLAVTSPDAVGRITEGQAIVGEITVQGTLAYLIFAAIPFGFVSAGLYLFVAPWLPSGRGAGPVFGAILLVTVSPFVDPLRADNFDFGVVGPGWMSVLLFSLLALLQGATLAAISGRLSQALPLVSRRTWPATVAALIPGMLPVGILLVPGAVITAVFPRLLPAILAARASRVGVITGRILLALAVVVALPAFVAAVVSIWSR